MGLYQKYFKRLFDFIIAAFALICFSPVLTTVAIMIKREDGGSIFYRGERVGRNGKPFKIYKFRTMVVNAENIGGSSTSDDDARITKSGKRLRKYKLDELPQLINVVKGEMSLVGPRPEVQEYVDMYDDNENKILTINPGITDWASIWNPDEGGFLSQFPDPDKAYLELLRPKKLELQKKYVYEISFMTDIKIICKTIKTILNNKKTRLDIDRLGG